MARRSFPQRGFHHLVLATGLGMLLLGILWAFLTSGSVPVARRAEAAQDSVLGPYRTLPRLLPSYPITWMTPGEEALWAAVGGLEAAYLMNPDPYANSGSDGETAFEDWIAAALDEEASAATSDETTPQEGGSSETLTHTVYLPLAAKSWARPEVRALWVTRFDYSDAESIRTVVSKAAYANFNVILFQVRANGDAYYRSHREPWSQRLSGTLGQDPGWDPLATAITAAHEAGLALHAYVNVYPAWVGETPPISGTVPLHLYHAFNGAYGDEWLQWDGGGPMPLDPHYLWASPGHPAVADHIISVCQDIVDNYAIDGLHLDNVRYAGAQYSHDPTSLSRYAAVSDTIGYADWQRAQVTGLVARIYTEVLTGNLTLSAAVWPFYDSGYDNYYQDSLGWSQGGAIDAIAPMLYARSVLTDNAAFEARVSEFVIGAGERQVWPGIIAHSEDLPPEYATFDLVAQRIQIARWNGAAGQAIFRYALIDARDYWDDFRDGPYAAPVPVPEMPWK
ncbi:MAG: family 10 glycosylhydrolase [Anaerolineae bacterium]|nr:MAG: family 10 glycosylhydrolase [Anaerolineae bacterium]